MCSGNGLSLVRYPGITLAYIPRTSTAMALTMMDKRLPLFHEGFQIYVSFQCRKWYKKQRYIYVSLNHFNTSGYKTLWLLRPSRESQLVIKGAGSGSAQRVCRILNAQVSPDQRIVLAEMKWPKRTFKKVLSMCNISTWLTIHIMRYDIFLFIFVSKCTTIFIIRFS